MTLKTNFSRLLLSDLSYCHFKPMGFTARVGRKTLRKVNSYFPYRCLPASLTLNKTTYNEILVMAEQLSRSLAASCAAEFPVRLYTSFTFYFDYIIF